MSKRNKCKFCYHH